MKRSSSRPGTFFEHHMKVLGQNVLRKTAPLSRHYNDEDAVGEIVEK